MSNAYSPRHYVIADTDEMSANKINSFELDRADRNPSTKVGEHVYVTRYTLSLISFRNNFMVLQHPNTLGNQMFTDNKIHFFTTKR